MADILTVAFLVTLVQASVRMATPLLFTALGEAMSERTGVLNIGLEGIMLIGAFTGFAVSFYTGANWVGTVAALTAGGLVGLAFALVCVTLRSNQVIVGAALNMLGIGLTGFLYRKYFTASATSVLIERYETIAIPGLSRLPIIGPALFQQNILVYIAFALVPIAAFVLYKTSWGLEIIAAGQHPKAADTVGINVFRVRYIAVIVGGMLAALGGSFLSMGHSVTFLEGMTTGRGFISLAVVIFGRWSPFGVLAAALLFGCANAFQLRLQAMGVAIPHYIVLMIPYIFTILAVVVASKRITAAPAALAQPYEKV